MSGVEIAAAAATILAEPIKRIFEYGKDRYKDRLLKINNARKISSIASKISAYEQVKTIWMKEKKVRLSSFYYPSKIIFDTGVKKEVKGLSALPKIGGVVIQGTVGQGKSIFLRYLCIQELAANSSGRVPIFVELRKIESSYSLEDALFATIESLGLEIDGDLFKFYAESGQFVVLLDGFDEIAESLVGSVITTLEKWAVQYPDLQFVVTSRPGAEIQKSNFFQVCSLAPLEGEDQKEFLKKIGVKGVVLDQLLNAIDQSHAEIKSLLTTPLLLTLLVLVYQSEGVVPSELPEFFKMLFSTVFVRHDRTKPAFSREHKSGLNERSLEQFFEAFCFAVMRLGFKVNLRREQFESALNDAQKFSDLKCDASGFKHDVINVACLLQEDGPYISFVHKSLLDFFPASFIKSCSDTQAEKIYGAISGSWSRWVSVLRFLEYIDKYRFAKLFAIPVLDDLVCSFGADVDVISDEKVKKVASDLLPNTAYFQYRLDEKKGGFVCRGFGPYNSFDCYFHDGFIKIPMFFPSEQRDSFDGLNFHITEEAGVTFYMVPWREEIGPAGVRAVEAEVRKIIEEIYARLDEYKRFVLKETEKAELLASFDLTSDN